MNITIGSTTTNAWKHFKAQYFGAVCGLVLAASAALAIGGWHGHSSHTVTLRRTPITPAVSQSSDTPRAIYYLVDSAREVALLQSVISTDSAHALDINPIPDTTSSFVTVGSPEAENLIGEATRELMQFGVSVYVVDLRGQ